MSKCLTVKPKLCYLGVLNLREFPRELTVSKDLLLHFLTTCLVCLQPALTFKLLFNPRCGWLRDACSSVLEEQAA